MSGNQDGAELQRVNRPSNVLSHHGSCVAVAGPIRAAMAPEIDRHDPPRLELVRDPEPEQGIRTHTMKEEHGRTAWLLRGTPLDVAEMHASAVNPAILHHRFGV